MARVYLKHLMEQTPFWMLLLRWINYSNIEPEQLIEKVFTVYFKWMWMEFQNAKSVRNFKMKTNQFHRWVKPEPLSFIVDFCFFFPFSSPHELNIQISSKTQIVGRVRKMRNVWIIVIIPTRWCNKLFWTGWTLWPEMRRFWVLCVRSHHNIII